MLKPTRTQIRTARLMARMGVNTLTEKALNDAHKDAKYYCDEWNNYFKTHGYHTNSYHVGIHNANNYYSLADIKEAIDSFNFINALGGYERLSKILSESKSENDVVVFNNGEWSYQIKELRRPLMLYSLYNGAKGNLK